MSCETTEKPLPTSNELEYTYKVNGANSQKIIQEQPVDPSFNKFEYERCIKNCF